MKNLTELWEVRKKNIRAQEGITKAQEHLKEEERYAEAEHHEDTTFSDDYEHSTNEIVTPESNEDEGRLRTRKEQRKLG